MTPNVLRLNRQALPSADGLSDTSEEWSPNRSPDGSAWDAP